MKPSIVAGVILVSVAIVTCLLLGTLGWFVIGFGVLTDCTNMYSCSSSGCAPCATARGWVGVGGVAQLVLAGAGVAVLIRPSTRRPRDLAVSAVALLALSVLTIVGTTTAARGSYCQPGTPGYAGSYCGQHVDGASAAVRRRGPDLGARR